MSEVARKHILCFVLFAFIKVPLNTECTSILKASDSTNTYRNTFICLREKLRNTHLIKYWQFYEKLHCLFLAHNLDLNNQLSIKSDHLEMQWGCFFFGFSLCREMTRLQGPTLQSPWEQAYVAQRYPGGRGWFPWRWLPGDDCRHVMTDWKEFVQL